jgi:putative transposase
LNPTQQFSNFLNAYAKAINKSYNRTGSLFQGRFGRIPVTSDDYPVTLVHYIHFNPQKHGFVADFREWPYSSYHALYTARPTKLRREELPEWFNGREPFLKFHQERVEESKISPLIVEDDD